ncbi:DNA transfer protein [Pantoea stewartii]|uniref:DNA transfer protein n=1 Tax=Pantoea stewartii TaxID=66269 RepID=UPI00398BAE6F
MKGGGDNGAGAQAAATQQATALQREQWQTVMNNLAPYMQAGQPALQQLQSLSTLQGQNDALNQYYGSDQYKQLANQARYQSLSSAEATGGLGTTATQNSLAAIAPALGQSWLSGQMQNQSNLLGIGMNAAAGQASAGQNYANNTSQLLQQQASLTAANANRPSQFSRALSGGIGGAAAGAEIGSAFGGPGIGTAIGAGVGLLGSLF